MLHWFRCENCYSFKNELDEEKDRGLMNAIAMTASEEWEKDEDVPFEPICQGNEKGNIHIWQVASIYGPNASGKSTFLTALGSMFNNITHSGKGKYLIGESFLFDEDSKDKPIYCEMCFSLPKSDDSSLGFSEYRYGYELEPYVKKNDSDMEIEKDGKAEKVISEWLMVRDLGSDDEFTDIFTQERNEINWSNKYQLADEIKEEIYQVYDEQRKDGATLVLRLACNSKFIERCELFRTILSWCRKARPAEYFAEEDGRWHLDGVTERIERETEKERLKRKDEQNVKSQFELDFVEFIQKFDASIRGINIDTSKKTNEKYELMIEHRILKNGKDSGNLYKRHILKESYGTQKIVGMYPFIYDALKSGGLLLIDELDAKMHPLVIRDLIRMFRDENEGKAQLIFTAHSLVALNDREMDIDEIYLISKDNDRSDKPNKVGKSSIKRLNRACIPKWTRSMRDLVVREYREKFKEYLLEKEVSKEEIEKLFYDLDESYFSMGNRYVSLYLGGYFGAIPAIKLRIRRDSNKNGGSFES